MLPFIPTGTKSISPVPVPSPGNAIAAASATLEANVSYTLYLFNAPTATEGLRAMIVSN